MYSPWGTFGLLQVDGFECWVVEKPWLDNRRGLSCIPCGTYPLHKDMHYGGDGVGGAARDYECYVVRVPGRTHIPLHIGNFASHVQGCLALGKAPHWFSKQQTVGVPHSADTFAAFMAVLERLHPVPMGGQWGVITIRNSAQGYL